jgi:hypothetical protein
MNLLKRLHTGVTALLVSVGVQAGGALDLNLSDEAIRVAYDATHASTGLHINLSGLHHSDDGELVGAGIHAVDTRDDIEKAIIGVGAKGFGFNTEDNSGFGVGVGGFGRYTLPFNRDLSVAAYAYYAPAVVSFGDAENMFISDWRLQFAVIRNARVYAGYRYNSISVEGLSDDLELGKGGHLGMTLDF